MAHNTETITATLGGLRKGLIDQGFDEPQAFQIVLDLIRRADMPAVLSMSETGAA